MQKLNYRDVFKALNKDKIEYLVAGGTAVILHGYPRFTADLDLIIHLEGKNIEKVFDTLARIGYKPKVPVTKDQFKDKNLRKKWQKEKGMKVFSFFHNTEYLKLIDIFIEEPFPFNQMKRKSLRIKVGALTIPVVSVDQLIKLKRAASRPKDLIDLDNLERISERQKNE